MASDFAYIEATIPEGVTCAEWHRGLSRQGWFRRLLGRLA